MNRLSLRANGNAQTAALRGNEPGVSETARDDQPSVDAGFVRLFITG
jgi:hypothetical protein